VLCRCKNVISPRRGANGVLAVCVRSRTEREPILPGPCAPEMRTWMRASARMRVKANADDQSAHPQAAGGAAGAQEGPRVAAEPAEARRVHARLHDDAEE